MDRLLLRSVTVLVEAQLEQTSYLKLETIDKLNSVRTDLLHECSKPSKPQSREQLLEQALRDLVASVKDIKGHDFQGSLAMATLILSHQYPCSKFHGSGPPWYGARCRLEFGHGGECDFGTPEEARRKFYGE